MADPNIGGIDVSTIWTTLGAILGTAIAAFAVRMGWKSGGKEMESPTQVAEIQSAIVDSSSVKMLAASIEGLSFTLLELKKTSTDNSVMVEKSIDNLIEALENQTHEVREHAREVRDHAREVAKQ